MGALSFGRTGGIRAPALKCVEWESQPRVPTILFVRDVGQKFMFHRTKGPKSKKDSNDVAGAVAGWAAPVSTPVRENSTLYPSEETFKVRSKLTDRPIYATRSLPPQQKGLPPLCGSYDPAGQSYITTPA